MYYIPAVQICAKDKFADWISHGQQVLPCTPVQLVPPPFPLSPYNQMVWNWLLSGIHLPLSTAVHSSFPLWKRGCCYCSIIERPSVPQGKMHTFMSVLENEKVRRLWAVHIIAGEAPLYYSAEFPSNIAVRLNKVAEDFTNESAAWIRSMLSNKWAVLWSKVN